MSQLDNFNNTPRIAYFTMEIALHNDIPTYDGGLGMLADDTMHAAADLKLPPVAGSLVSRADYFHQKIDAQETRCLLPAMLPRSQYHEPEPT